MIIRLTDIVVLTRMSRNAASRRWSALTWLNQGGYTVSNAHLSYTTADEKYNITGFVNNLTDKHYQTHGLSLNRGSAPYWAAFGDPRTAGVTVTAKF